MYSTRKKPDEKLTRFVKYFWYFKFEATDLPVSQLSFPYGNFELFCYLQNPNRMQWLGEADDFFEPQICYAGQVTKPFVLKFDSPCECVGVSFQPWAGNCITKLSAATFTNQLTHFDDLNIDTTLSEKLKHCNGEHALFACLENFLFDKLNLNQTDQLIETIIKDIYIKLDSNDNLQTNLDQYGLSRRRIEQKFKDATGLSLLTFRRKARFQKSISAMTQLSDEENLTSLALRLGYFDQAHFIHDFKKFAGVSPKIYLKEQGEINTFLRSLI